MTRHLHIQPLAGIAGDMFLGGCIDLGTPLKAIEDALGPLNIQPHFRITTQTTTRHGITGIDLKVIVEEHDHHHNDHHHHTTAADILQMIDKMDTADRAKNRARKIVTVLGQAEATVHEVPFEKVHFHEVGAVDSIVDMLGSAVALEWLNVETISSDSLPIGHGFVNCAHGRLPLPAPATAEILKHVPHHKVDRKGETVTPTGAALVAALADSFDNKPAMQNVHLGHGAGDRKDADSANMLRLTLGDLV